MGRRLLVGLLLWSPALAGAEGARIVGHVSVSHPGPDGQSVSDDPGGVGVFLKAEGAATQAHRPPKHYEMHQKNKAFSPAFLVIRVGDTVDFVNDDALIHNVFSLSKARPFDIGRHQHGEVRSVTFNEAGSVDLFCDIHEQMRATIIVVASDAFSETDASGAFEIANVAPGTHTVVAWRGRGNLASAQVSVPAGGSAQVKLELVENVIASEHLNKHSHPYSKDAGY
jgi:plastocyanin